MAERYTYSVLNDFPNQTVVADKLSDEVGESTAVIVITLGVTSHEDSCHIDFEDVLPPGEETALDAIVAAHDGVPYPPGLQVGETIREERTSEFASDNDAYTEVVTLNTPHLDHGNYKCSWFILYGVQSVGVNLKMRIQVDGTDTELEYIEEASQAMPGERIPRSGFVNIHLDRGTHAIDIDCSKDVAGEETWHIYKAFLELRRRD
jgi:hypothetical protein